MTIGLSSCSKDDPDITEEEIGLEVNEWFSGGENFTTSVEGKFAFGQMGKKLAYQDRIDFAVGNATFNVNWVTAPGSVRSLDGLGPIMNAISCKSCHFEDGRAAPPPTPQSPLNGLLFRLSIPGKNPHGGPLPDPIYGGQLQDKAILGVNPEALVSVSYTEQKGTYEDGSTYSLRVPNYKFHSFGYGDLAAGWMHSPRIGQQIIGLGLLEEVAEKTLLEYADESDSNGDGISGRANYVWDIKTQKTVIGRFGWKANEPTIEQQIASAFNGDIGITSKLFPKDHQTPKEKEMIGNLPDGTNPDAPEGEKNELFDVVLADVTTYTQLIAVPGRRSNYKEPNVIEGKRIFHQLNCVSCHRPKMKTSNTATRKALRNQIIRPYTDLLLHDMGEGLADNRPDFLATGREWRTPPLWGISRIFGVNGHTTLLHDGRARNMEEAILWHGGEAEKSKEAFKKLPKKERDKLLAFLNTL